MPAAKSKPAAKKKVAGKTTPKTAAKRAPAKLTKPAPKLPKQAKKVAIAEKSSKNDAPKSLEAAPAVSAPGLNDLEARFCREYLLDHNGTQSYLRCKPNVKATTAAAEACRILRNPNAQAELQRLHAEQAKKLEISAEAVVLGAWRVVNADTRELMEYRVGCCRYCWGFEFGYQRSDAVYRADQQAHADARAMATEKQAAKMGPFREMGGPGYLRSREPNPECPECAGEGEGRPVFKDTTNLSPEGAELYAGVEVTKEGIKLRTHSKDASRDKLFRHLGLYNDKITLTMPTVVVKDMTGRKD